ncbi:MAG: hypothetical protein ACJ75S_08675 [Solirubrobacterales bacterium]
MRKPGYLTTEFWLVVITTTLTNLGTLPVPERFRWVVTLGSVLGYSLSRAIAKLGSPPIEAELPVHPVDVATTTKQKRELTKDRKRAVADAGGGK